MQMLRITDQWTRGFYISSIQSYSVSTHFIFAFSPGRHTSNANRRPVFRFRTHACTHARRHAPCVSHNVSILLSVRRYQPQFPRKKHGFYDNANAEITQRRVAAICRRNKRTVFSQRLRAHIFFQRHGHKSISQSCRVVIVR